ncbi:MAG: hypothetical protein ACW98K_18775 [Candidatus Kariarchaeaceae archaeon]|jgi:hypothetical protein
MGYSHIIVIRDDAIRFVDKKNKESMKNLAQQIGEAILNLSISPYPIILESGERQRTENIGPFFNAIEYIDEFQSADAKPLFWFGNTLWTIRQLDDENLAILEKIIEEERKNRENRQ